MHLDRARVDVLVAGRVVDKLAELALAHLGGAEAEHEQECVDGVTLAGAVGSNNGRKRLVERPDLLPSAVRLEVVEDELVDREARLGARWRRRRGRGHDAHARGHGASGRLGREHGSGDVGRGLGRGVVERAYLRLGGRRRLLLGGRGTRAERGDKVLLLVRQGGGLGRLWGLDVLLRLGQLGGLGARSLAVRLARVGDDAPALPGRRLGAGAGRRLGLVVVVALSGGGSGGFAGRALGGGLGHWLLLGLAVGSRWGRDLGRAALGRGLGCRLVLLRLVLFLLGLGLGSRRRLGARTPLRDRHTRPLGSRLGGLADRLLVLLFIALLLVIVGLLFVVVLVVFVLLALTLRRKRCLPPSPARRARRSGNSLCSRLSRPLGHWPLLLRLGRDTGGRGTRAAACRGRCGGGGRRCGAACAR